MHEIVKRDQSVRLGGLNDTVEDGTGPSAVAGIREHPVFTANDKGFHRALHPVVIDSELPVLEVASEFIPLMALSV